MLTERSDSTYYCKSLYSCSSVSHGDVSNYQYPNHCNIRTLVLLY